MSRQGRSEFTSGPWSRARTAALVARTSSPRTGIVCAGEGNDTVYGGHGNDVLIGDGFAAPPFIPSNGANDDELVGGYGDDLLAGLGGDDLLRAGAGDDEVIGFGGVDTHSRCLG